MFFLAFTYAEISFAKTRELDNFSIAMPVFARSGPDGL